MPDPSPLSWWLPNYFSGLVGKVSTGLRHVSSLKSVRGFINVVKTRGEGTQAFFKY